MYVVATAGHVDHGKSTLVQALTGTDPDRLDEEHRRGLSIELGYCWTTLDGGNECAFVDVPGHERFVPTMLTGVGPVPAVLFVAAADDTWMPQAAEHLAALDAFGVRHGVLAVTRSDLADPEPLAQRARAELSRTGLAQAPIIPVSARTGAGLPRLRRALGDMVALLPIPDLAADVRLWLDRRFVIRGAGTVATGTLQAGTVAAGDILMHGRDRVRVRGVQTLGREVESAQGVARVALRLGGNVPNTLGRGSVLASPGAWQHTSVVDIRVAGDGSPTERPVLHIGATSMGCRYRPFETGLGRVTTQQQLPLRVGDTGLLRDPGTGRLWGLTVLDPAPPSMRRRGAARARAVELRDSNGRPDLADELGRRGWAETDLLERIGIPTAGAGEIAVRTAGWLLDRRLMPDLSRRLGDLVAQHTHRHPLAPGMPTAAAAQALGLPDVDLVAPLLPDGLCIRDGLVTRGDAPSLPAELERALRQLAELLRPQPFSAPDAERLRDLGLDRRALAAADRAGRVLRVSDVVVLLPGTDQLAADLLRELPQPFTPSQARVHLDTTRRVVLPLLQMLDRRGLTMRLPDDRRRVTG